MSYEYKCVVRFSREGNVIETTREGEKIINGYGFNLEEFALTTEDWLNEMSIKGWELVSFSTVDVSVAPESRPRSGLLYVFRKRLDL